MRNFQREATAIGNLHHSNLVSVYDFGITLKGEPYLVMEYIDGPGLGEIILKEGRIQVPRLLKLCLQVCAGLTEAHSKGIVHCDLKPNNIMIKGVWPNEQVKVVDFGLAQMKTGEPQPSAKPNLGSTSSFFICGTPLYMSPEQCYGQPLGPLSDIYSLGCIIYESLTGVNIFQGASVMETFAKQCEFVPPPLSDSYDGSFSPDLELCVSRMLDKDPLKRPQSMAEVKVLLQDAFESARKIIIGKPAASAPATLNAAEQPPNN
jgi:serine/threonine-protein kinase